MDSELKSRLIDMLHAAEEAMTISEDTKNAEALSSQRVLLLALERLIGIIGEAAYIHRKDLESVLPETPWQDIINLRHRIVHDYRNIRTPIIFKIVKAELPKLVTEINQVLSS